MTQQINNKCVDCGIETEEDLKLIKSEYNYNCQANYQIIHDNKVYCACCIVNAKMEGGL